MLVLSGQLIKSDVADKMFVGELSLNGELRPVKGIINVVEAAKEAGSDTADCPRTSSPASSG